MVSPDDQRRVRNELRAAGEELRVSIDGKRAVQARLKLRWNFRGNQAVFVDGAAPPSSP